MKYNINKYIDNYKTGYDIIKLKDKSDLTNTIKYAKCNKKNK